MFMLVPIVKFRLIIFRTRVDFERVLARCRSHDKELSSSTPRYGQRRLVRVDRIDKV